MWAARAPAISAAFLTALISVIGSGPMSGVPPAASMPPRKRRRARGGVDPHPRLARAERRRAPPERSAGSKVGDAPSVAPASFVSLRGIDEHGRAALARDQRVAERQRRVGHVAAADVEGPGEVCGSVTEGVGLSASSFSRMRASFASSLSPANSSRMRDAPGARAARGGRSRSRRQGCHPPARASRRPARPPSPVVHAVGRVQPRVVAERRARLEIGRDPCVDGSSRRAARA